MRAFSLTGQADNYTLPNLLSAYLAVDGNAIKACSPFLSLSH